MQYYCFQEFYKVNVSFISCRSCQQKNKNKEEGGNGPVSLHTSYRTNALHSCFDKQTYKKAACKLSRNLGNVGSHEARLPLLTLRDAARIFLGPLLADFLQLPLSSRSPTRGRNAESRPFTAGLEF